MEKSGGDGIVEDDCHCCSLKMGDDDSHSVEIEKIRKSDSLGMFDRIPSSLIEEIFTRLNLTVDRVRFGAVCRSWRAIATSSFPLPLPPQFPWTMLSTTIPNIHRDFFSPAETTTYKLNLPSACKEAQCCGSSEGFLVMQDAQGIFLVNPLSQFQLQLPTRGIYFRKVVLSSSANDPNCTVAGIDIGGALFFCNITGMDWIASIATHLFHIFFSIKDIIFYKEKFWAIDNFARVIVYKFHNGFLEETVLEHVPPPLIATKPAISKYLVESGGELLMVLRDYVGPGDRTTGLHAYKLDQSGPHWTPVQTLGPKMLFIGYNSSKSLSADDFPGFKANCIYFTDDDFHRYFRWCRWSSPELKFTDSGVFYLEDATIEPLPLSPAKSNGLEPLPFWFTPSLK